MKATSRNILLGGTPSKTTLPRFATDLKRSATGNLGTILNTVFSNHSAHRLRGDAREFVDHVVELLERDGGLAA